MCYSSLKDEDVITYQVDDNYPAKPEYKLTRSLKVIHLSLSTGLRKEIFSIRESDRKERKKKEFGLWEAEGAQNLSLAEKKPAHLHVF